MTYVRSICDWITILGAFAIYVASCGAVFIVALLTLFIIVAAAGDYIGNVTGLSDPPRACITLSGNMVCGAVAHTQ